MSWPLFENGLPGWLLWIFRWFLGLIFLYASIRKILSPQSFAADLMAYQILDSPVLIRYLAVTLPWIEWFCGIFLLMGVFVRSVSLLTSTLLVLFFLGMSSALLRGLEIHCGCLGSTQEILSPLSLLRDGLFFIMSLAILFSKIDSFALQTFLTKKKLRS